jgi:hypothetical protein
MYLLEYNYEAKETMWSICVVNQQIVLYWRIYVAKHEEHMNKEILNINSVQHLWLAHNQERVHQVLVLSNWYLWKLLYHKKKIFKNESMEDMKWRVKHDDS